MNKHVKNGGLCALALATLTINIAEAAPQKKSDWKKFNFFSHVETLADASKKARKKMGTAPSYGVMASGEEDYLSLLASEFNYITPENVAKWGPLQPVSANEWDFSAFDSMLAVTQDNKQKVKGHALVWHRQAPNFVNEQVDAATLAQMIDNHITTTMQYYAGEIYAWDVVNEVMGDDANYRQSVFYKKLGKSYIADAYISARAADPRAKLFYNDYGIDSINAKSDAVYTMMAELIADGVPIDGIGFQMHLDAASAPSTEEMTANLQRFADLGLSVNISEIDVRISSLPWDDVTNLAIQQQVYHRAVNACMNVRQCDAFTLWGFTDKYTWIDGEFGEDAPLIYDDEYQRKPAYFGVADGLLRIEADEAGQLPNLIANGNLEIGLDGWSTWAGELKRTAFFAKNGRGGLRVKNRTENWHGAVYDISEVIKPAQEYDTSVWTRVLARNQQVSLSLMTQCDSEGAIYQSLDTVSPRLFRWSQITARFTTPDCDSLTASLYIEGPQAGIDLFVDGLTLRPKRLVPNTEGFGPNLIDNSDFEQVNHEWFPFGDPVLTITTDNAYSGSQSLLAVDRTETWQGPALDLTNIVTAGNSYQLFAQSLISASQATVKATIRVTCPAGDQYIGVGGTTASNTEWRLLGGLVTIPNCNFIEAVLYFEGPSPEVNIFLDDVVLHEAITQPINAVIQYSDFENGLDSWSAWGGDLQVTSAQAYQGTQSALLSNRTGTWQGPLIDLLSRVQAGQLININGYTRIEGIESNPVNITVKTLCAGETEQYQQLASVQATNDGWTAINGSLTLPNCQLEEVFVYFDGPVIDANIYLDEVTISTELLEDPNNLITNPHFEQDTQGWVTWGDANISQTDIDAHSGNFSALVQNRTAEWQGAVYDLLPTVTSGQTYQITAWSKISSMSTIEHNISITVKSRCEGDSELYNGVGAGLINNLDWQQVTGELVIPECTLAELFMYFDGLPIGVDYLLDDVSVNP